MIKKWYAILRYFLFFLFILPSFWSCSKKQQTKGAIAFTFDDRYIKEWASLSSLFEEYHIHATFFISRPQELTQEEISILKTMEKEGHEIACHGLHHLNAKQYKDSASTYLINEVLPAKQILENLGFHVESYAYPFGNSTPEIDNLLRTNFAFIRKAHYNIKDTTLDVYNDIYASKNEHTITNAMGIDYNFNISMQSIKKGISRAKINNEILILYAHNINTVGDNYCIQPAYLEEIFRQTYKAKLRSVRCMDIKKFYK